MKTFFRSALLITAVSLSSCELIPDEVIDIFKPEPKPEASCELVEINHPSDLPDQSFTLTIDSSGANEVTITGAGNNMLITPKENSSHSWDVMGTDEKGMYSKEVTVDAQKRLSRVLYIYNGSTPEANLAAKETTYNYDKVNIVEAITLEMEGSDTITYKTTFEYSLTGNLMKISSEDNVVTYEYGSIDNKLHGFQKAFAGFDVYNPITYNTTFEAEVPLPSRKLPTKQLVGNNMPNINTYTWTINSNGYPTKLELLDERQETRRFEYGYENCKTIQ